MRTPRLILVGALVAAAAAGGVTTYAVTRGDHEPAAHAAHDGHSGDGPALGAATEPLSERAFLDLMIPHHQMALEMAEIALDRTDEPAVVDIASDVLLAQKFEIDLMRRWREEWFGASRDVKPRADDLAAMGMDMDMDAYAAADPFPERFYREMIPHHQGAILMARRLLRASPRPELARFARGVIRAQTAENARMRQLLTGTEPVLPRPTTTVTP